MNSRIWLQAVSATALGLVGATLAGVPAYAQDNETSGGAGSTASNKPEAQAGGEIVVTAQRRAEASRDVPISITAISQSQMATANVNSLADTSKLTPGLRFDSQGPAVQPTIRGVGTAITTSGGGPNVGIYVDGFFQSNTYVSDFQLMRTQSIQVLKGPQGTLFGRNTTGGAILVTTADPSTDTGGEVKASYGRFNSVNLQAYATTGITDRIAFDIEGLYRRGDGYMTDDLTGSNKIGKYEDWSIRTGLKVQVSDDVSVLLRYTHSDVNDPTTQLVNAYADKSGDAGFFAGISPAGQAIYGQSSSKGQPLVAMFPNASGTYSPLAGTYTSQPGHVALNPPTSFRAKSDVFQGTVKADLGFADLTSYTQYRHDHTPYYGDLDATAVPIFNILVDVPDSSFSQEFLLSSKHGSRLQWTAGLNYYQIKDTWNVSASFGGSPFGDFGGSSTNTRSFGAFVDATYEVADKLFLTLGGRYSHDVVGDAYFITNFTTTSYTGPNGETVPFTGAPGTKIPVDDLKHDNFTPRVVLRYKPNEASSIYASFTQGYKAGILNVGGLSQQPVAPEKINAYEVGYKYENRRFSADLAGFYYDYKNLQVSSYQNGAAQIRNAASSEIYGAEAQLRYRVTDAFNVYGGVAWTHARYKSFPNAPYYQYCDPAVTSTSSPLNCLFSGTQSAGGIVQTSVNASGYHMQRSPDFTGNLGASYDLAVAKGKLTLSGNLYYTSSFYFDPEQQFKQDGYALLSLRAQWIDPSERYTVAVYGDNVTDHSYQTQVLFNTLGIGSVWSPPVTYGVQLGAKF
jgi:iron complex outermembrane receptor protein